LSLPVYIYAINKTIISNIFEVIYSAKVLIITEFVDITIKLVIKFFKKFNTFTSKLSIKANYGIVLRQFESIGDA